MRQQRTTEDRKTKKEMERTGEAGAKFLRLTQKVKLFHRVQVHMWTLLSCHCCFILGVTEQKQYYYFSL